jgi:hypothetical protein
VAENLSPFIGDRVSFLCGFAAEVRCDSLRGDWVADLEQHLGKPAAFVAAIKSGNAFAANPVCLSAAPGRDRRRLVEQLKWTSAPALARLPGPLDEDRGAGWEDLGIGVVVEQMVEPSPDGSRAWRNAGDAREIAKVSVQELRWRGVPGEDGAFRIKVDILSSGETFVREDPQGQPRGIPQWDVLKTSNRSLSVITPEQALQRAQLPTGARVRPPRLAWSNRGEEVLVYVINYATTGIDGAIATRTVRINALSDLVR